MVYIIFALYFLLSNIDFIMFDISRIFLYFHCQFIHLFLSCIEQITPEEFIQRFLEKRKVTKRGYGHLATNDYRYLVRWNHKTHHFGLGLATFDYLKS